MNEELRLSVLSGFELKHEDEEQISEADVLGDLPGALSRYTSKAVCQPPVWEDDLFSIILCFF